MKNTIYIFSVIEGRRKYEALASGPDYTTQILKKWSPRCKIKLFRGPANTPAAIFVKV